MDFENQLQINTGFYTVAEIAHILHLPYYKVSRWINDYWDDMLGKQFESKYSWEVNNSKAVSFHTLVELYVMMQFSEAGVTTRQILSSHKELSKLYQTAFPFALKDVLQGIHTDGNKIFLKKDDNIITLDGTMQLNLDFIKIFFKKLDYDSDNLASRYWPLGKEKAILVDPKRKFGHPVLNETNIFPETIYKLHVGGESVEYISYLYEISEKYIKDAIDYCSAA